MFGSSWCVTSSQSVLASGSPGSMTLPEPPPSHRAAVGLEVQAPLLLVGVVARVAPVLEDRRDVVLVGDLGLGLGVGGARPRRRPGRAGRVATVEFESHGREPRDGVSGPLEISWRIGADFGR